MTIETEFSRPVRVDDITTKPLEQRFEATVEERLKLAERFNILEIKQLTAETALRRQPGDIVVLDGRVEADVVQACVVTLQPVPAHVEADFTVRYLPPALWAEEEAAEGEGGDVLATGDDVEALPDDAIDVGEVAAQYLSLALEPYPRAPDAADEGLSSGSEEPPSRPNPFAVLKNLKERG